ncbi:MAG: winged helix-turn-helix domain-containing protein [Hoeflea sp. D1-CHI-28]
MVAGTPWFADQSPCDMLLSEAMIMRFLKRNYLKSSEITLGRFVFDLETDRLHDRSGREVELRYRSRQVLAYLVRHRGEVVTRAALIRAVWDVPTVSDGNVAQCIADIRRAISDTEKRMVETVPRQGYRLVALPLKKAIPAKIGGRRRFGSIGRSRLHGGAWQQPPGAPVVAVLPFGDHGITGVRPSALRSALAESIITDLARHPEMTVISRFATARLPVQRRLADIFARLSADFLVTGTLQCDGAHARVSVQLVSAEDLSCVWVDDFDLDLGELLALSQLIGRRVANVVGAKVIDAAEARLDRGDVNAMLIENAARSRILRLRSKEAWRQNVEEQEFALQQYPDAAWGNFGQALAIHVGTMAGWLRKDVDAAGERAEGLVARALAVAPDNYLCYYALGSTLAGKGEMKRAINAFERAAKLNPASTLVLSGMIEPCLHLGDTARTLDLIAQAERIDPFHTYDIAYKKAWTYWQMGDPQMALEPLLSTPIRTDEDGKLLAVLHLELGNLSAARDALEPFLKTNGDWTLDTERTVLRRHWAPEHLHETWLSRLSEAGMPS